eukprot:NODE_120_length_2342_cov_36.953772_g97_i0.p1 GENE.NODE_120_length_2342_cov_36.953772_g97_i0~~NODE_120_length_2342_cov_36.953772_g97_i0.p1  ORF type:complete len:689 (+),score=174.37 NODE_120_length_2342_cov_36.953772_g97_i0:137-2203(+)
MDKTIQLSEEEQELSRAAFDKSGGMHGVASIRNALQLLGQFVGDAEVEEACALVGHDPRAYMSLETFLSFLEIFKRNHLNQKADAELETVEAFVAVRETEFSSSEHSLNSDEDNDDAHWGEEPKPPREPDANPGIPQETLKKICQEFELTIDIQQLLDKATTRGSSSSPFIQYDEFKALLDTLDQPRIRGLPALRRSGRVLAALQEGIHTPPDEEWDTMSVFSDEDSERPGSSVPTRTTTSRNMFMGAGSMPLLDRRQSNVFSEGKRKGGGASSPSLDNHWPRRRPEEEVSVVLTTVKKPPPPPASSFAPMFGTAVRKKGEGSGYSQSALTKGYTKFGFKKGASTLEVMNMKGEGNLMDDISPRDRAALMEAYQNQKRQSKQKPKRRSEPTRRTFPTTTTTTTSKTRGSTSPKSVRSSVQASSSSSPPPPPPPMERKARTPTADAVRRAHFRAVAEVGKPNPFLFGQQNITNERAMPLLPPEPRHQHQRRRRKNARNVASHPKHKFSQMMMSAHPVLAPTPTPGGTAMVGVAVTDPTNPQKKLLVRTRPPEKQPGLYGGFSKTQHPELVENIQRGLNWYFQKHVPPQLQLHKTSVASLHHHSTAAAPLSDAADDSGGGVWEVQQEELDFALHEEAGSSVPSRHQYQQQQHQQQQHRWSGGSPHPHHSQSRTLMMPPIVSNVSNPQTVS